MDDNISSDDMTQKSKDRQDRLDRIRKILALKRLKANAISPFDKQAENKKPLVDILKTHDLAKASYSDKRPTHLIVLAADIRKSTLLMRESVDFVVFASILGDYVKQCKKTIRELGGWFDKFTGDGFLAFWVCDPNDEASMNKAINNIMEACHTIIFDFQEVARGQFMYNAQNFTEDIGISLGIDSGPCNLVDMADDLTIVGRPVVGAVRMVSAAAKPGETVINVFLGSRFHDNADALKEDDVEITKIKIETKEYSNQIAYMLKFRSPINQIHYQE